MSTTAQDRLTLAEIAPYLPFRPIINCGILAGYPMDYPVLGLTEKGIFTYCNGENDINGYSTLSFENYSFWLRLRPLNDLTLEIEHNGERFVPMERLFSDFGLRQSDHEGLYLSYYEIGLTDSPFNGYECITQLCAWHFDVFGLLDRGLAVVKE